MQEISKNSYQKMERTTICGSRDSILSIQLRFNDIISNIIFGHYIEIHFDIQQYIENEFYQIRNISDIRVSRKLQRVMETMVSFGINKTIQYCKNVRIKIMTHTNFIAQDDYSCQECYAYHYIDKDGKCNIKEGCPEKRSSDSKWNRVL